MASSFSVKQVLTEAYNISKLNLKILLVVGVVVIVYNLLLSAVSSSVGSVDSVFLSRSWQLVNAVLSMYTSLILLKFGLKLVDGTQFELSQWKELLLVDMGELIRYSGVSIIVGLLVFVGTVLFVIPGLILGTMYGVATLVTLDQKMGVKASLAESRNSTKGHRLQLLGLGLILGVINFIGLIPFGLGLLVTIPFSTVATVVFYRKLTDTQSNAAPTAPVAPVPAVDSSSTVKEINEPPVVFKPKTNKEVNNYQI